MLLDLRRLLWAYYGRAQAYLAALPGSVPLTGVLGLAALLLGYHYLRRDAAPDSAASRRGSGGQAGSSGAAGRLGAPAGAAGAAGKAGADAAREQELAAATPLGRAVRSRLSGVRKVTICALGALTEEWSSHELADGATLRPEAAELLREVAGAADTYLITHVQDDVGQAVVTGSLEAAGLLGHGRGQVPPHHVLFCSTPLGKVSVVRQLEPDLHVDSSAGTIDELRRFMPQLLHIPAPGGAAAAPGAANVLTAASLAAFFGQQ